MMTGFPRISFPPRARAVEGGRVQSLRREGKAVRHDICVFTSRRRRGMSATVKFFDPARGFGFVMPDGGGAEVFVHSSVLFRSGMTDLLPGQRVVVRAERAARGLQARGIEPL